MQNKFVKSTQVCAGDLGGAHPVPSVGADARHRGMDKTKFSSWLRGPSSRESRQKRTKSGLSVGSTCGYPVLEQGRHAFLAEGMV